MLGPWGNVGSVPLVPDTETMPVMDQGSAGTWPLATLPATASNGGSRRFHNHLRPDYDVITGGPSFEALLASQG